MRGHQIGKTKQELESPSEPQPKQRPNGCPA